MSKIYQVEFSDTIKKSLCKGDEHDKTYFDFNTYTLKSTNQFSIIEQYGTIKEKGLYALLRVSAIVRTHKVLTKDESIPSNLGLSNVNLRNSITNILNQKANELKTTIIPFAFSIDTKLVCHPTPVEKVIYFMASNWILMKLEDIPQNSQLYSLLTSDAEQIRRFLSGLLYFSVTSKQIDKYSLIDAMNRGASGFHHVDKNFISKIKDFLSTIQDLKTIPVIRQVISIAPTISEITKTLYKDLNVDNRTFNFRVFALIPYQTQIVKPTQSTQPTQTKQTTQSTTTPTTAPSQETTSPESKYTLQLDDKEKQQGINPVIFLIIGVVAIGVLVLVFIYFRFRKK